MSRPKTTALREFLAQNTVLLISAGIILVCSLTVFYATGSSYLAIEKASLWVRNTFGYFYLYLGLGCVLLLLGIAFSPLGRIRLGKHDSKPEHSLWAWSAMLYSAGMGAGILLRAVQEPVFMWQNPPYASDLQPEILALEFTFYQWGLTAWAFYALFAMIVGYALFVKKKKVSVSATMDETIKHPLALKAIDVMTIITTVFGLIAAVGLGTAQIHGGLSHLLESRPGIWLSMALASLISLFAFISAWKGVNKGIKILSKINIIITLLLLSVVFLSADPWQVLTLFGLAAYHYLLDFIPMSLAWGSFDPGMDFLTDWSFYYWAFWLAWAPFTGIFIARISRGRTIRQLIFGVLFIPSMGTFFWFSVFGNAAFEMIQGWESYNGEFQNVFTSIFIFFAEYPFSALLNTITIVLLISFLVTSVDSAVFVLSMFTDKGRKQPAKRHRLMWSVFILIATLALLLLGSAKPEIDVLTAVQKLLIITSLPFAIFMIAMALGFIRDLSHYHRRAGNRH